MPTSRRKPVVGVSAAIPPALLALLPAAIELAPLPPVPAEGLEVEFWIAPPYADEAMRIVPRLRGLRVIQSVLAGVEWLLPLAPPGVTVCDARGVHTLATAEWALAVMLATLKYLPFYVALQQEAAWQRRNEAEARFRALFPAAPPCYPPVRLEELRRKTVLILGYGAIGAQIERLLLPFRVRVLRVARRRRAQVHPVAQLPALLPAADIVVVSVPLTAETVGLVGAPELARMPRGALLVNLSRGGVVDTPALVEELHRGRIRAALDVTDPEPLPAEHALWRAPNVLITPHVAASSPEFMVRAMRFAAAQLRRYLQGAPLRNVVSGSY
ncbi:MAG: NAD(P)-dependent oxidoreductase [Terriglobales bacterium]